MKNILIYSIIVTGICTFLGCEQQQSQESSGIKTQPDVTVSAVAQYVRKDDSWYITQQQFEIYTNPQAIMLIADEPYGKVVWSLENGVYKKPKSNRAIDKDVFNLMTSKEIAGGLMNLYLASLGNVQFSETSEMLNFDGKIYILVSQNGQNVKFYKNKSTGVVDLVVAGQEKEGVYLFSGYNYLKMRQKEGQEVLYPSKVDIYLYKSAIDKKMLAQLNCSLN